MLLTRAMLRKGESVLHSITRLILVLLPFSIFLIVGTESRASGAPVDVNVGVVSFDVLNPASPLSPGVNQFSIYNFTGSNNLAPDFPSATNLTFLSPTLDVGSGPVAIGDLAPGVAQPASLEFISTDSFASAIFNATLSATDIFLADGTHLQLTSNQLTATLLPSSGNALVAGTDFALLTVTGSPVVTNVPEPAAALLLLLGCLVGARYALPRISTSCYNSPSDSDRKTDL